MTFALSQRSFNNLKGVHPDLVDVVKLAIKLTPVDFMVIEGLRTMKRQRELVAKGASQTLNSRHLDGHAVDLAAWVDGSVRWDWPLYHKIAHAVKKAARELAVPIEWGGDWITFKDGPHWQLPFDSYPKGSDHSTTRRAKPLVETFDAPEGATPNDIESMSKYKAMLQIQVIEDELKDLKAILGNIQ